MLLFSILIYIVSLVFTIIIIVKQKTEKYNRSNLVTILFLIVIALYTLPLPIHCLMTEKEFWVSGDISYNIYNFVGQMPTAVFLVSFFNVFFAIFYTSLILKLKGKKNNKHRIPKKIFLFMMIILIIVSFFMLQKLGESVGGIVNIILLGYKVTEYFLGQQIYAIAFEWLVTVSILFLVFSVEQKNKKYKILAFVFIILLGMVFMIMGRRALIVVLGLSVLFIYHVKIKKIKFRTFLILLIGSFFMLNVIGLLRGDSYESLDSISETISNKSISYKENNVFEDNIFYTLTTGNFSVPFETMPQSIEALGTAYNLGYGFYSLQSVFLLVPSSVWNDRPLPLSNWYMKTYYGENQQNIGRQFYILTSAFMDFGVFGILLISLFLALLFSWISVNFKILKNDFIKFTILTLFVGNILNLVSNDLIGFSVVFFKSFLIPIIILSFFTKKISITPKDQL